MKITWTLTIICITIFLGCAPWKDNLKSSGNYNTAVKNAVVDFLNTSRLSKRDTVFSVSIKNINDKIMGISIMGDEHKLFPDSTNKLGTSNSSFPTRYLEKEGKLFYWYDSTHHITRKLIAVLSDYNHIDSLNVDEFKRIPESIINDAKEGVDYYFCKNNLIQYKKVRTSRAMGYYKPPNLNCSQSSP